MFLQPYPTYSNPSGDGENYILLDYLYYTSINNTQYRGIVGGTTDGPSVPALAQLAIKRTGADIYLPCVLHDLAYRCFLEQLINGQWKRVQLDYNQCNQLLNEAMISTGTKDAKRIIISETIKLFAVKAFTDDLAQPIKI